METRRTKCITTFINYYCSFALGVGFLFLSPAVIDLSNKFETSVEHLSRVFTIITISYLCGTLMCGVSFKYLNRQLVIILLFIIMSTGVAIIPLCPTLTTFYVANAFLGFTYGGTDTGLITWMLETWRHECAPYVLAQNFAFGLGTFLPPLILQPFLQHHEFTSDNTTTPTPTSTSTDLQPTNQTSAPIQENKLVLPFFIGGAIISISVLLQVIHYITISRRQGKEKEQDLTDNEGEKEALLSKSTPQADSRKRLITLVILSCLVVGFYQAMELTNIQFLPTFSVYSKKLGLSEADGAQVLFIMTMAFATTRGIGIFVAFKVKSEIILVGNFIFLIIANIILIAFAQESIVMLWIASILLGIGLSTVFPCYYAFIERYLNIDDLIGSIILVFGGSVASIYPLIVGKSVETNPSVLCYVNFTSIAACTSAFILTYYLTVIKK